MEACTAIRGLRCDYAYSTTYHSRASECLQNIRGTDLVLFVVILLPQMSNILLLKSVLLAQPQSSNKIMCPYYPYVVLYILLPFYYIHH